MCVKESDVREVLLYRAGLVTVATSFMTAASAVFMLEGNAVRQVADLRLSAVAALYPHLRHPDQALPPGALGGRPLIEGLVQCVLEHLAAHWFVGPTFAALTAEGICKCSVCFLYQNMSGVNAVTVPCSW